MCEIMTMLVENIVEQLIVNAIYSFASGRTNRVIEGFILHSCFCHTLRGYDSHILMQSIGKYKDMNLKVIPSTTEKYIAFFFLGNLKFIDSYQFMGASLQKLVTNLAAEGKDKFQNMMAHVQNSGATRFTPAENGTYPYDYVDEPSKFA